MYVVIDLDPNIRWVESINFFIYDSIKILMLLFLMILIIGFLRTYIPQDKVKIWVSKRRYGSGNLIASSFGAITPFCSCSSIPVFISFLKAGVPLGVTFSFLITSPIVNEYMVVLMLSLFGWKITLAYVICGIIIGTISGWIFGRMNLEKYLVKDLVLGDNEEKKKINYNAFAKRVYFGLNESWSIIKKLWLWVLLGVAVGAVIHNYVPSEVIQSIVRRGGSFAVPVVVLLGMPMYGSCAAILPIAVVLFDKGMPLGTTLAFMMSIAALSFPEAVILRRAMKFRLIAMFFGIVALAIVLTGYIFNFLQEMLI